MIDLTNATNLKVALTAAIVCALLSAADAQAAGRSLIEEGAARAEVVIAEQPLRTVRLAAQELQDSIGKITSAHLPIVTRPTGAETVPVYFGCSEYTDRLGVTADGLRDGAYRIVSGDGWLVLIGQDTELMPTEPWARNNSQIVSGKLQREWEQINSGSLLMVRSDSSDGARSRMTAFVSDDGATWKGGLLLDERESSYSDGVQAADGTIYVIYDHQRYTLNREGRRGVGSVQMAVFQEDDARAGRLVMESVRLRVVVTQLRDATEPGATR